MKTGVFVERDMMAGTLRPGIFAGAIEETTSNNAVRGNEIGIKLCL